MWTFGGLSLVRCALCAQIEVLHMVIFVSLQIKTVFAWSSFHQTFPNWHQLKDLVFIKWKTLVKKWMDFSSKTFTFSSEGFIEVSIACSPFLQHYQIRKQYQTYNITIFTYTTLVRAKFILAQCVIHEAKALSTISPLISLPEFWSASISKYFFYDKTKKFNLPKFIAPYITYSDREMLFEVIF